MKSRCWRCEDRGFVRDPCQQCGALRVNHWSNGQLVRVEIVYQVGSVWGNSPPPMTPRPKRQRVDR